MSFFRAFTKSMSVKDWYTEALGDSHRILDRRININLQDGKDISKSVGNRELIGVIDLLKKANDSALVEFQGRNQTKKVKEAILNFQRSPNHTPFVQNLFNCVEDELTLFSLESAVVDLYDYLLKLNLSLKYLIGKKTIDSNSSSLLGVLFTDIINLIGLNRYTIDFMPLTHALSEAINHGVFDLNEEMQKRLNILAEVHSISVNALEVLCSQYKIKN